MGDASVGVFGGRFSVIVGGVGVAPFDVVGDEAGDGGVGVEEGELVDE